MLRFAPVAIAVVGILSAAVVNGFVTERWTGKASKQTRAYAACIQNLPIDFGPWRGTDQEVDAKTQKVAGAVGYLSRTYRHADTGEEVQVWLINGHASEIVRHTPEICYTSSSFRKAQPENHFEIPIDDTQSIKSWTALFHKNIGGMDVMTRVFWMWHDPRMDGPIRWEGPGHHVRDARHKYGGAKSLMKLYFTTAAASTDEPPQQSNALGFAKDFVPMLNQELMRVKNGDFSLAEQLVEADQASEGSEDAAAASDAG
ncbi:MAG: exosortase-associated EpsI family protein [Planctomycetota bacterium]